MKKLFAQPEIEVERFAVADVVTASEIDTGAGGTEVVNPFG